MRSVIILAMCVAPWLCAARDAQIATDAVPKVVMDGLRAEYPNSKIVSAGVRTIGGAPKYYELEIQGKGREALDVYLDTAGVIISTGTSIKEKKLPEVVRNTVAAAYPGGKLSEILLETNFKTKAIFYSMDVTLSGIVTELEVSADGKILKAEAVNEND